MVIVTFGKKEGSPRRACSARVVGDRVEESGFSHALALVVDDQSTGGMFALKANLDIATVIFQSRCPRLGLEFVYAAKVILDRLVECTPCGIDHP